MSLFVFSCFFVYKKKKLLCFVLFFTQYLTVCYAVLLFNLCNNDLYKIILIIFLFKSFYSAIVLFVLLPCFCILHACFNAVWWGLYFFTSNYLIYHLFKCTWNSHILLNYIVLTVNLVALVNDTLENTKILFVYSPVENLLRILNKSSPNQSYLKLFLSKVINRP